MTFLPSSFEGIFFLSSIQKCSADESCSHLSSSNGVSGREGKHPQVISPSSVFLHDC